jgi:hypothetical protein
MVSRIKHFLLEITITTAQKKDIYIFFDELTKFKQENNKNPYAFGSKIVDKMYNAGSFIIEANVTIENIEELKKLDNSKGFIIENLTLERIDNLPVCVQSLWKRYLHIYYLSENPTKIFPYRIMHKVYEEDIIFTKQIKCDEEERILCKGTYEYVALMMLENGVEVRDAKNEVVRAQNLSKFGSTKAFLFRLELKLYKILKKLFKWQYVLLHRLNE